MPYLSEGEILYGLLPLTYNNSSHIIPWTNRLVTVCKASGTLRTSNNERKWSDKPMSTEHVCGTTYNPIELLSERPESHFIIFYRKYKNREIVSPLHSAIKRLFWMTLEWWQITTHRILESSQRNTIINTQWWHYTVPHPSF